MRIVPYIYIIYPFEIYFIYIYSFCSIYSPLKSVRTREAPGGAQSTEDVGRHGGVSVWSSGPVPDGGMCPGLDCTETYRRVGGGRRRTEEDGGQSWWSSASEETSQRWTQIKASYNFPLAPTDWREHPKLHPPQCTSLVYLYRQSSPHRGA